MLESALEAQRNSIKANVENWNARSKSEMFDVLEGFRTEVTDCKSYVEGLEDRIKLMSIEAVAGKDELELRMSSESTKIEKNLHAALNAGVIEDLNQKVAALTSQISEKPSEEQIEDMLRGMETTLSAQFGDSRAIQIILENLKLDLRRKVTRNEVLDFVKSSIDQVKDKMKMPDDMLMAGKTNFRCLSCNQTLPHMHGTPAKKVPHKALSPVSSTFANSRRPYMVENGIVLATYPHGRAGALRPMGMTGKSGIPRDSLYSSEDSRESSGQGSRGKLGAGFSISQKR